MRRREGRDETFEAKRTVLEEIVEHHGKEEGSTMVDRARRVMGKKLQTLGAELQAFDDRAGKSATSPGSGPSRDGQKAADPRRRTASLRRSRRQERDQPRIGLVARFCL